MFHFARIIIGVLFLSAGVSLLQDRSWAAGQPFLLGHNLTPTTHTLLKGHATAGTYALAYGVTDDLLVGVSPWMIAGYGMPMVDVRYRVFNQNWLDAPTAITVEGIYFHTWKGSRYDQESVFLRVTASRAWASNFTTYLSTGHQYFWNDRRPFSLNPNPRETPYVPSVSAMVEWRPLEWLGFLLEGGALGLDYEIPYSHYGGSIFYQNHWLVVQMGISKTTLVPNAGGLRHWLTHPETQIQFFFEI